MIKHLFIEWAPRIAWLLTAWVCASLAVCLAFSKLMDQQEGSR